MLFTLSHASRSPPPPFSVPPPQSTPDTLASCVPSTQSRRTSSDRARAAGNFCSQTPLPRSGPATGLSPSRVLLHNPETPPANASPQIPAVPPGRQMQTARRLHWSAHAPCPAPSVDLHTPRGPSSADTVARAFRL